MLIASIYYFLLVYVRKAFVWLCPLAFCSCKDFKSWANRYTPEICIQFEQEKDEIVLDKPKDLQSVSLYALFNQGISVRIEGNNTPIEVKNSKLPISLNPATNSVSFEIVFKKHEPNIPDQKVTIRYKRTYSLISHEAGGWQIQYIITAIEWPTKGTKKSVFKKHMLENPIPLQEHKEVNKTHVTLYY